MKKDPYSEYIDRSVISIQNKYDKLMRQTKLLFFDYLQKGKTLEEFKEANSKIWDKVNHEFMTARYKELEEMIDKDIAKQFELTIKELDENVYGKNEYFKLEPMSRFTEVERKYKNYIDRYYKSTKTTLDKEYIDETEYLSKQVSKYNEKQATIPYHNQDGSVRCYQTLSTYCSMLYNTNLTRVGWNRTMANADFIGEDLLYLPSHTGACPLCIKAQGYVYSKSGLNPEYRKMEEAIDGTYGMVGHPNCKHEWLIYSGKEMLQENKYDSAEWEEYYKNDQKLKALQRERTKLKTDRKLNKKIGNMEEVDKLNLKIRKFNSKIKEQKELLK